MIIGIDWTNCAQEVNRTNGVNGNGTRELDRVKPKLDFIHGLKRFMSHMWNERFVRKSTKYSEDRLRLAIQNYIIIQPTQAEDNHRLAAHEPGPDVNNKILGTPNSPLFDWTHFTSGDHNAGFAGLKSLMCRR